MSEGQLTLEARAVCGWCNLRRVYGRDLLLVAGLDELPVDVEAQGLQPLRAIGSSELDFQLRHVGSGRER